MRRLMAFIFSLLLSTYSFAVILPNQSNQIINAGVKASVAANALTVNLVQSDGASNPSNGSSAVSIAFRNATSATGGFSVLSVSSSLSVVAPSSATLGQISGATETTYVYAQNNSGAVQMCLSTYGEWDEGKPATSTSISSSATTRGILYCTSGASGAVRLIGYFVSSQSVAGNWASAPTQISVTSPYVKIQKQNAELQYYQSGQWTGTSNSSFQDFGANTQTLSSIINNNMGSCAQDSGHFPSFQCNGFVIGVKYYICANLSGYTDNNFYDLALTDGTTLFGNRGFYTNSAFLAFSICGFYVAASNNPDIRVQFRETVGSTSGTLHIGDTGSTAYQEFTIQEQ